MKRDIETALDAWKQDDRRRPLLVRGARQVGKSHTIEAFGRRAFDDLVVVNFEQEPRHQACFSSLDPGEMVASISVVARKDVVPGKTLLFLDEIQECPSAITALRYFFEQMPQLHVIGAGSLLEFALESADMKMPVGRIQYLYMGPMSFAEFLDAVGEHRARRLVAELEPGAAVAPAVHEHLLSLVRKYLFLGGMPAVLAEYLASGDLNRCQRLQTGILQTYRDDFGKYANKARHSYLQKIFYAVSGMVGEKFKYSKVDPDLRSRELKAAFDLLEQAGVIHRVKRTDGAELPLEVGVREGYFKAVFLDVGLMQNLCGLSREMILADDLLAINAGAVAEQFVAQELLAHRDPYQPPSLYYWAREARSSSAEVDYLVACGARIVPVEVKAGKTGALRSMRLFLDEYAAPGGVRISMRPFDPSLPVISLPLYAIEGFPSYVEVLLPA